ncbi:MAG TPA: hypothetical protein VHZ24_12820 [Pirellulales bacterium]|jgi:hypothetical protein|nr:hypothetical protein [Pirellulales bacterium]
MNRSRRRGADEWRETISAQAGSGLSIAAYCRDQGISQPSFFVWRRRLRQTPPFIEVKTLESEKEDTVGIEIHLRGGRRLLVRRGFDPALLVEVVRTLEGAPRRLEGSPYRLEGVA